MTWKGRTSSLSVSSDLTTPDVLAASGARLASSRQSAGHIRSSLKIGRWALPIRCRWWEWGLGPQTAYSRLGDTKVDFLRFISIDRQFARVAVRYHGQRSHDEIFGYLQTEYGPVERLPGSMIRGRPPSLMTCVSPRAPPCRFSPTCPERFIHHSIIIGGLDKP